jgi:hypothetical protein
MRSMIRPALVAGLFVVATAASSYAVTSPHTFSDTIGDAPKGVATDVQKVTVTHANTVKIALKMGKANPFTSWSTNGNPANINVNFKAGGYYIFAGRVSAALFQGETQVPNCPVTRSRNGTTNVYTFTVKRSCLGNPSTLRVQVVVNPMNAMAASDIDHAPNGGYYAGVDF